MTAKQAQIFGAKAAMKTTAFFIGVLLLALLIIETRSDFANGILFFMQAVENIHFIVIMTILFACTFFCGKWAGKEIIIDQKNMGLIAAKYCIVIILVLIGYAAARIHYLYPAGEPSNMITLIRRNSFRSLAWSILLLYIPMSLIWLFATNEMRKAALANSK
jgi:hypothetical protein